MAIPGGRGLRVVVVIVAAALASFHVLRTAAVADRESQSGLAAALWPSHPSVLTDEVLLAIATGAASGQPVSNVTRAKLRRIAAKAPLSPDPFLIEGAIEETEGHSGKAERLLLEARLRDPRSRGARYLLAERFFRTGRVTDALVEMQALASLQPGGGQSLVPALAAYARTPGALPQLRAFLRKYPRVEAAVLSALAVDAENADLILGLATVSDPDPDWRRRLVATLVKSGQFARAHAIWARHSGGEAISGLFNPSFQELPAPPPFNWAFRESREGVAEPNGRGGVDVLYYGRANAALARQLLLLRPGRYRLVMTVEDASGEVRAVRWHIRCAKNAKSLADLPLRAGTNAIAFDVPLGCDAQWLDLRGVAGDSPRTTELTIRGLQLAGGEPQ